MFSTVEAVEETGPYIDRMATVVNLVVIINTILLIVTIVPFSSSRGTLNKVVPVVGVKGWFTVFLFVLLEILLMIQ